MKKSGTTQIKEIADRLGISPGTVSIVLNGRGDAMRISKATQQRVKDVAKEMNYQPNIYARRLRNAATEDVSKVIAVFWSIDLIYDIMGHFFKGLQETVKKKNYKVEFFIQLFDHDSLHEYKDIMSSSRFSGIIISSASDKDVEFLNENTFDLPIILMNRNEPKYHSIYLNDYEVGKSTARLFKSRHHEKVGLISMKHRGHGGLLRHLGFLESCKKYDLTIKDEWVLEPESRDYIGGYESMQSLLKCKDRPTAIFVMSPSEVLGAIIACKDANIKIPEDLEILTFGDSTSFTCFSPTVSTVHIPMECLAENALNLMVLVIDNGIEMPMSRMLCAEYTFRESCGGFLDEN